MSKEKNTKDKDKALHIGDVINSSLVLKTDGNAEELIRIQKDGRIFIRGEETYDERTIGQAVKLFALYYPNCL